MLLAKLLMPKQKQKATLCQWAASILLLAALRQTVVKTLWRSCTNIRIHVSSFLLAVVIGFLLSMQALAELLKVTHRGYFIPPRPEKNPVEGQRASNDFVELRRHALEKYLIQLASHPAIIQSDVSTLHTHLVDCLGCLMALTWAQLCAFQACGLLA